MLRFFPLETIFDQETKSNKLDNKWICKVFEEVPIVEHSKFPSVFEVFAVISNEGHVMALFLT